MWPAIIGAVGGLASGIINNGYSQANAAQAFQNQKELMRMQNQYSRENWALENAYNTPKAQMERLRAAGLNPNLIYGNGASGLQSGSISSPGAPSAPMAQTVPFENPISSAVEAAQGIALAKKAKEEGLGQKIENQYNENVLSERIQAVGLQNKWTKEQITNAIEQFAVLATQATNLDAQTKALQSSAKFTDTQEKYYKKRIDAEIKALVSKSNLDDATKKQVESLLEPMTNLINAQKVNLETLTGLTDKYGDAQAIAGIVSSVIGAASDLIGAFTPFKFKFGGKGK